MGDTAGQERFGPISPKYYSGCDGVLIAFDLSDAQSFESVSEWNAEVLAHAPTQCSRILVGNKADIDPHDVSQSEAEQVSADLGMLSYFRTSAQTGENVDDA